ncbi:MAG: VWA domain-containing protein [Candidatus Hydrogenedentes bacterium]|nr:VWA domain-containing protein [Candidatus Hydrogenedentota bacterium]
MLRPLRCTVLFGLVLAAIALSGCPTALEPGLSVSPLALNFGVNEDSKTLRIRNTGGGVLTWTAEVTGEAPWLTLESVAGAKQAQMVEGESTTEVDTIALNVNRALLAQSTSRTATVTVTSNAGTQTVSVSVAAAGPAQLNVSPTALSFGSATTSMQVTIGNTGSEALSWSLAIPADAPWLAASRTQNSNVSAGSSDSVEFTVNRAGLPGGNYTTQVPVTSNGGDAEITVTMSVPPLVVSTSSIEFGALAAPSSRSFTISNPSDTAVSVQISSAPASGSPSWFSVANVVTSIEPLATVSLDVLASPAGLDPGDYSGTITVTSASQGFSATIAVSMDVAGFAISPNTVDFGSITATRQSSFVIENLTSDPLPFEITVPAGNPWLSVSPTNGNVSTLRTIQLTANPNAVDPGNYTAEVEVVLGAAGSGLRETVTVSMSRPEPARLEASPRNIVFGTSLIERRVAIWNVGIGTVDWRINSSGFPAWLSLSPTDGGGVASGSVTGDETDEVVLRIDRSRAPEGVFELQHSFTITASRDASNTVTVNLTAAIAQSPVFVLQSDDIDDRGIPTLAVPATVDTRTFVIRNEGNGTLAWSFGTLPSWIASLNPSQGSLEPNVQQTVTLRVNRTGLSTPGVQTFLEITTNDPDRPRALLDVSVSVAPVIVIGARPGSIGFQEDENAKILEIYNDGDPGTILNYQVVSNKEWLAVSPATGSSQGTASALKDFQPHSVSVDRSRLDGESASGRLIISAFLIQNGVAVPNPNVATLEIPVTVEAAGLTIESALPSTRVPSLLRNVLMLRNVRSEIIPLPESRLNDVGALFRISENEVPLELTETNQFLKKRFTANLLVLLDFSGSMRASAEAVLADGQLGDPASLTEDALKTLYLQAIPQLLDELPAHFRVGLGVFNDHAIPESGVVRMINPADGEPAFTRDKAILQSRLASVNVQDNGATDLIPAVIAGTDIVVAQDANENLIPFDDAHVKGIIMVTDGRDTSLGRVTDAANYAIERRVRLFIVGWGAQVNTDPIIRLATSTGGHYYSTRSRATGAQDPFGVPIRIPLVSELQDWCALDAGDVCDQSLPNDLANQVVLNYSSLNREPSVLVKANLTFNDPNDQNSPCLPEQGEISAGVSYPQQDFSTIQGDNRAGQIALETEGISGGQAVVVVRADYIPRNITRLSFNISVSSLESPTLSVARAPQTAGGLISNWDTGGAPPTYTFSSPDGAPLRFSDYGDLLYITVSNVTQAFTLNFEVVEPVYSASNFETKYFTHPDSILVSGGAFLANSFPAPYFDSRPAPQDTDASFIIPLDDATDRVEIDVYNLGGSHVPPGAAPHPITGEFSCDGIVNIGLCWRAAIGSDSTFLSFVENTPEEGFVTSTFTPSTMFIDVDRSVLPPGPRRGRIFVTYNFGSVNVSGVLNPIIIDYDVQRPAIELDETFINFGFTPDSQDFGITNVGQSTLVWRVNTGAFPAWLELSDTSGNAGPGQTSFTTIHIIRENLPEGEQEFDIVFTADFATPATLTVAAEGLPAP